jgi:tryptophanyl-tRNA synthetase
MNSTPRVLSTMSPIGPMHLGHYFGAVTAWKKLQYEFDCFFMVADLHNICRHSTADSKLMIEDMIINWLACGIDPSQATLFIQSRVPEQSELMLLLAAITPLSWLERVPSYKERITALEHTDLNSYGYLGLPLLQSSGILTYGAKFVTITEENIALLEFTREIARRFNHLFGREEGFAELAQESIKKLGSKKAEIYQELLIKFQQDGSEESREKARFLLQDALNLAHGDRERLFAFLENKSKVFLTEPQILPHKSSWIPGIDGQKMAHGTSNTINLRDDHETISKKIRNMVTDPARIRRNDKGSPDRCPVWKLHEIYSTPNIQEWCSTGCTTADIGCLDCKQPLIDAISRQQQDLINNAAPYIEDPTLVKRIISDGCLRAREVASENIKQIKQAMNIDY